MSDCYTPTDGEVLEAWAAHNTPDLPTALDLVGAYDAFKRWLAEHDAALLEGLADEIAVEIDADAPDDFLRGFDAGSDAVYAALREKARQRREEQDRG